MSKLPRTRDLPQADEGYEPARVEEAFATFAERVRELEEVASELREELQALRAERSAPSRVVSARFDDPRFADEVWPAERQGADLSPDWVGDVPPPLVRGLAVPRLALEGVFLALVALFAGLADLAPVWIVLVMTAAWVLVALAEWTAAARRARWRLDEIPPSLGEGEAAADATGPWDMPVVQATVVDAGPDPESQTIVAKLPADPEESELPVETEPEPPPRRRGFLRRRKPAETAAADPWEA